MNKCLYQILKDKDEYNKYYLIQKAKIREIYSKIQNKSHLIYMEDQHQQEALRHGALILDIEEQNYQEY